MQFFCIDFCFGHDIIVETKGNKMLKVGGGIWMYGSLYNILSIEKEENEQFEWLKINAKWSMMGPSPLFPKDVKTFLVGRKEK